MSEPAYLYWDLTSKLCHNDSVYNLYVKARTVATMNAATAKVSCMGLL